MARTGIKLAVLAVMIVGGFFGLQKYEQGTHTAQLKEKDKIIEKEQEKNKVLRDVVKRLQTDKRVAKVIVTDQVTVNGKTQTTLLFGEYARDGASLLPQKRFVIDGVGAHFDAQVIQFDGKYVEENDPLRSHSVALFKRIFGDYQTPKDGFFIDPPAGIPEIYKGSDPRQAEFEQELWKDFWKLADDPAYRAQWGVKMAYGSSSFREEFRKGYVYTLTLDPTGGLKMAVEKMDPMYERALEEASTKRPS